MLIYLHFVSGCYGTNKPYPNSLANSRPKFDKSISLDFSIVARNEKLKLTLKRNSFEPSFTSIPEENSEHRVKGVIEYNDSAIPTYDCRITEYEILDQQDILEENQGSSNAGTVPLHQK